MKKPKAPAPKSKAAPQSKRALNALVIQDFLERNNLNSYSFKQLSRELGIITKEEKIELADILRKMVDGKDIFMLGDGSLQSGTGLRFVEGRLDFVNPKFAYVVVEGREQDIFIAAENLRSALDGDIVKVRLFTRRANRKIEGEVAEIISRKREEFVGRIEIGRSFAFVIPDNKRTHFDIFVNRDDLNGAKNSDKVIVKITDWGNADRNPVGIVTSVLGPAGDNDTEMHAIVAEFGLPYEFPEVVEAEAQAIPETISEAEIAKRRDMRSVTTFTIDPADAKDFDDALSIQKLSNGNWEIGVHIADVSHYVLPNTELEKEAYKRATSVYLVDRTIPMLPEKLSNNLCSLRPNEDKLTFSAVFELDDQANIKSQWFGRTVIHSDRRFSYEQAQEILEGAEGDYKEELLLLNRLAYILRDARFKKGSIAFETPEVKFVLDERGTPLAVTPKIRKDAHKLIEDYMLLANKKVAEFVFNMRKGKNRNTMVYRVHEAPDPDRLKVFSAFAKKFGYRLDPEHDELATQFNSFITALENKPEQDILQNLAVRTMSKAKYTTEASGHFGLAFEHYSHFTSPIRRYPDVMAHRLLEHYLEGGESVDAEEWEKQCKHSSEQEKRAAEAERASIKYKQVQFMMLQETKVWDGIVSGVTEYGFYVEIVATKCEGMVRISDLQDDYYELDADNYRLIGTRTKRVIAFGDKVEVKVKNCNLEKRIIDLSLVDEDLEYYSTMKRSKGGYVPPQAAGLKKRGS